VAESPDDSPRRCLADALCSGNRHDLGDFDPRAGHQQVGMVRAECPGGRIVIVLGPRSCAII
jgi:hypothetical protein